MTKIDHTIYTYYSYNDVLSKDSIKNLHDIFDKNSNENVDDPAKNVLKTSSLKFVEWSIMKQSMDGIEQSVLKHNKECIGYNLWSQFEGDNIILNEYDSKNQAEYGWHKDHSNNFVCDIKLTVLINVSLEKYEGGKFYLFGVGGERYIPEFDIPGSMIIFKSDQVHKVTPVTKGKRHSITMFYKGPRWQ